MIKRILSLGAAALATLVGGCGDGPSVVAGGYRSPATWSSFIYATRSGPLLLRVLGDPFRAGPAETGQAVAESMAGALPGRPFVLTLRPEEASAAQFRVVVALGAPAGLDERSLCAGPAPVLAPVVAGGRVDLIAVFCDGDGVLSSVRGWVAKVEGPGDRRFHQLLGQAAREMIGSEP